MTELSVCIGSACHLKGSYNVIQVFQQLIEEYSLHDQLDFKGSFCMKECQNKGVSVTFDGRKYSITPETASEFFKNNVLVKMESK